MISQSVRVASLQLALPYLQRSRMDHGFGPKMAWWQSTAGRKGGQSNLVRRTSAIWQEGIRYEESILLVAGQMGVRPRLSRLVQDHVGSLRKGLR